MGLLSKLLHRGGTQAQAKPASGPITCPHTALLPRWDSVDDMGHEERATSFTCDSCGQHFTPQEARELRASEAERLALHTETSSLN